MRRVKWYEFYENDKLIGTGSAKSIAAEVGLSENFIRKVEKRGHEKYRVDYIGTINQVYAYYVGDEFMAEGTIEQIAEETGELIVNLNFLRSDAAKTRNLTKALIKLEGETVIVKRTHGERFAPVPTNDERREEIKVFKNVPVKPVEWKPSDYTKSLFEHSFSKWRA